MDPATRFRAAIPAGSATKVLLSPRLREIARRSPALAGLPDDLAARLMAGARVGHHPRGETLFRQGDPAGSLMILAEGRVKLYRIASNGIEAVVGVLTRGQSFGEPLALAGESYPVSAESVADTTLVLLPAETLRAQLGTRPEVLLAVLAATSGQLRGLIDQIERLKARSGAQRVAEFLLDLCEAGGGCDGGAEPGPARVTLPYDKGLIAGHLGMKPESLSRAFARLRGHGVSVRQSTADIASVAALRRLVEEDPGAAWSRPV